MSMSHKLHPLALEFLRTQIDYVENVFVPPPAEKKPIWFVLSRLNDNPFGYIDVMQECINVMKKGLHGNRGFGDLVEFICELARKYDVGKANRDNVLIGLDPDEEFVPIQIKNVQVTQNGNFINPIYHKVRNSDPNGSGMALVFRNLLEKIRNTLMKDNYRNKLLIICRYLREQVIPVLEVLTKISKKNGGKEFIEQLDLRRLINELREIQKMEKEMENDDQKRADIQAQREQLMRTSTFNVKSIMPQVESLVADKQFIDSGNASQSVIGDRTISVKGGRRTRHKRSGKRSGNKRSGKRSSKRSGHKSRRR